MNKLLGLPILSSKHGADVDALIIYVHWLMGLLFVGWLAFFLYALWRFQAKKSPKADYVGATTHASSYIELAVAFVEAVLLIGFAVPLWAKSVQAFPADKDSTVIRVTGRQFNWIARYPGKDGIFGKQDIKLVSGDNPMGLLAKNPATKAQDPAGADDIIMENSEVVVPVNKPVIVHVSSLDVIHSFKVIPMRVTQDAIPGMSIPVHFIATQTNTFQINCAQLCGNGHAGMKGVLKVLSQQEFDTWYASKSGAGPVSFE